MIYAINEYFSPTLLMNKPFNHDSSTDMECVCSFSLAQGCGSVPRRWFQLCTFSQEPSSKPAGCSFHYQKTVLRPSPSTRFARHAKANWHVCEFFFSCRFSNVFVTKALAQPAHHRQSQRMIVLLSPLPPPPPSTFFKFTLNIWSYKTRRCRCCVGRTKLRKGRVEVK